MKVKTIVKLVGAGILALLLVIGGFSSATSIDEGHVGVQYRFGQIIQTDMQPGLHFKVPFIDKIVKVDVREQIYVANTPAYTRDTQTVESIEYSVNYRYSDPSQIIKTIGIDNVETQIIIPRTNAILKNLIGQFRAEDLVQGRATLQAQVTEELTESLAKDGIVLTAFNIKNLDFEDSFEEAIRLKVEAEQEAMRKQNETVAKEEEAKQTIIAAEAAAEAERLRAEAEAYSIRVIQEQLSTSPQYTELQKVLQWNGVYPDTLIIDGNTSPFVILD